MPLACAGNKRLRKAISLFLYLKTKDENGSGTLNYHSFIIKATEDLHVHEKTIRNWLKLAQEFGVIEQINKGKNGYDGNYRFLSWNDISSKFECFNNRFYYIKLQNINFKIEYILERFAIEEKQKECENACLNKYNYYLVKEGLNEVVSELGIKNNLTDLKNCQQYDFLTAGIKLTESQRFFINIANPDINVGYKRFSEIFGYKSRGGFAYMKRKLLKHGLIDIKPRQIQVLEQFRELMTTKESRTTKLGCVNYFRPLKTLVLTLCDQITPQPQSLWQKA